MVQIRELGFGAVLEVSPAKFGDNRGFFSETYNRKLFNSAGLDVEFVQDNHSYSAGAGTLRGLHFQVPPAAQGKLVRVTCGEIFDVAVDIRNGSPTFGQWVGVKISAADWNQIFIPPGFAHGFVTLAPDTEVVYKVTDYYSPEHDRTIRYDDQAIGIDWPSFGTPFELSQKDSNAPLLAEVDTVFIYSGESQ